MDPTKVVGRRTGAFIIDLLISWAVNAAIFFSLAKNPVDGLRNGDLNVNSTIYGNFELNDKTYSVYGGTAALCFLLIIAFGVIYWIILPGTKGWTVGKLLTGIRVQKEDGSGPPGIGKSFIRNLMWIVDGFPYVFYIFLVGFVTALSSDRHQRLGDRVANTVVVDKAAFGSPVGAVAAGGTMAAPPPLAPEFQPGTGASPPNWPS